MANLERSDVANAVAAGILILAPLLLILAIAFVPRHAEATPAYSQQTKLACGSCHTNPSGGGALTSRGKKFQAKGHKL
jgi:hypothetical protein